MNGFTKTLIIAAALAFATGSLIGCSKTKDSGSAPAMQCDAYGCYPANPNYDPYDPYSYNNPNQIVLAGNTNVTFHTGWLDTLESLGFCGTRDLCGYVDSMPIVQVVFNDYKFTNGTSTGIVSIGNNQVGVRSLPVNWRKIDGDTAIDTQVSINNGMKGRVLRIRLSGRDVGGTTVSTTVSQMSAELFINGVIFSSGDLYRVNRPSIQ